MAVKFSDLVGQTVSFEIYPSAIIGTKFTNAIVRGIVDSTGVTDFNPAVQHANVYATVPHDKIVDDFRKYNYLRVELQNGKVTFVGIPWIIEDSLKIVSNQDLVITIPHYGSMDSQEFVRRILLNNGIENFTLATK